MISDEEKMRKASEIMDLHIRISEAIKLLMDERIILPSVAMRANEAAYDIANSKIQKLRTE